MRQHCLDRDIVRFGKTRITGERPQHAQRLRRRHRRVKPSHSTDHLAVGQRAVLQRETQLDTRHRVSPGQQTLERPGGDRAIQSEQDGLLAGPLPG